MERIARSIIADISYRKGAIAGMTVEEEKAKWKEFCEAYEDLTMEERLYLDSDEYRIMLNKIL